MITDFHLNPFYAAFTPHERAELEHPAAHLTPAEQQRLDEMFMTGEITIAESAERCPL